MRAAAGTHYQPFALATTGGHGASTAAVYYLLTNNMRDSSLPSDVLFRRLKRDISLALRRGTFPRVTIALDAAQRAGENPPTRLEQAGRAR
jgi:hypothetical protein